MATLSDARSLRSSAPYWVGRAFVILLGLASIAWGGFLLPIFWQQSTLHDMANEYVQGHTFAIQSLLQEAELIGPLESSSYCNPTALHDIVMLRLAILEEAVAQDNLTLVDSAAVPLEEASWASLSCAPADPFVWLVLFWVDARKQGAQSNTVAFLRLSYASGPNEGWIDLWRNQLVMKLFEHLPDDLKNDALDEFMKLVNTGRLYEQTAAIFAAATPSTQSQIAARVRASNDITRRVFATVLYDKGVDVGVISSIAPTWQPSDRRKVEVKLPEIELPSSSR